MATFVVLEHPATILVTDFTNCGNLTNDPLILNSLKGDCETLLLGRAFKQNYLRIID